MTINDLRQNPLKQSKLGYMTERRNSENTLNLTAWLNTIALCYHTYPAMERRNELRRHEKQGVHTLTECNQSYQNNSITYRLFIFTIAELKLIEALYMSSIE
jgi:hypothetical protein